MSQSEHAFVEATTARGDPPPPLACTDPALGRLLAPYALGRLAYDDAQAFEAHMVRCEWCADDAAAVTRTALLMEEYIAAGKPGAPLPTPVVSSRSAPARLWMAFGLVASVAFAVGLLVGSC